MQSPLLRSPRRALRHRALLLLTIVVGSACLPAATEPPLIGEGRRVLFIGNSYLAFEDIPGIVQALADSAGEKIATKTIAASNAALIDHWQDGRARREIAKGGWEWVVLQQGPSSVALNRDTLRLATSLFAGEMTRVGATPALFSAWPSRGRRQDFPAAIESYALAAADVSGIFLPVASSWLDAWDRDPALELYADNLHANVEGAYLSALVVVARLLGKSPRGMPATIRLHSGVVLALDPAIAATLQDAAAAAAAATPGTAP